MRVFQVLADVNTYQSLEIDDPRPSRAGWRLWFDGSPRAATWEPLAVRSTDSRLPRPDVFNLSGLIALVFSESALRVLRPLLEGAGEFLPLSFNGETVYVLNVTPLVEGSQDPERALLPPPDKPSHIDPYRFAFLPERLPEAGIFRIPEAKIRLLSAEDVAGRPSLRRAVEEAGLTGLNFRVVWDPALAEAEQECRERLIQLLRDHPGEKLSPQQLWATAGAEPPSRGAEYDERQGIFNRVIEEVRNVPGITLVGEGMVLAGTTPPPVRPAPPASPPGPPRREGDLVALLKELGCHNPRGWAASEEQQGLPQVGIYTFMRSLWPELVDRWRNDLGWIEHTPPNAAAELLAAGARPDQLGELAAAIAYSVVFDLLSHLDDERDPAAPDDAPGWQLVETNSSGETTGRALSGSLHELLLQFDPSGQEGRGLVC